MLFTLYISDCTTNVPNQYIKKYSDDSTPFTQSEDHTLYQDSVDWLMEWCDNNSLIIIPNNGYTLITVKTEEIIFGKPPDLQLPPVKIHNSEISQVPIYKYLSVMIGQNHSWTHHIEFTCIKIQQHIYFLQRLRSFGASTQIISLFFTSVFQSVVLYCSTVWQSILSAKDKA